MTTLIDAFKAQQTKARAIQDKLLDFLAQGKQVEVTIDPALEKKLQLVITANDKLRVALIGGFSEGKTSIAAAWLGKLKDDMKISHQESSDAIVTYEVDNNMVLIDTPGLFGYKEKHNLSTAEEEKYKDITRKYVSESHLVLYVMNSTNPLKESHKHELQWLFRDLNLLPRTVFVLSRFDEVADVADEEDYQHNLSIKKQSIISRLHSLINLKEDESRDLAIVAVAANPFDAGMEHWLFSEPERFQQLSHIALLQQATTTKISTNGGLERIALDTSKSIISDILLRELPVAKKKHEEFAKKLESLSKTEQRTKDEIQQIEKSVVDARTALSKFVVSHFTDLIVQLNGTNIETMGDFFEREIGKDGTVLTTEIEGEFSKYIDAVDSDLTRISISLDTEVSTFNAHMSSLGRKGLELVVQSKVINAGTIKAVRDIVWSSLKFKPWGAVNLAKGINGALVFLGVALETWESWKEAERIKKFDESKQALKQFLEELRKDLLEQIKDMQFPLLKELGKRMNQLSTEVQQARKQHDDFSQWRTRAVAIEAEFKVLKN